MTYYPLAKALHIIGFACWFAGLFFTIRLFIYRVEARDRDAADSEILEDQLAIMTRRLWIGITWPSMILTVGCGSWLLYLYGLWSEPWLQAKLIMIALLVAYHLVLHSIFKELKEQGCLWSAKSLRLWNEVVTMLLVATVFVAVFKRGLDALWATIGFFLFVILLRVGIKVYGKIGKSE